MKKALVFFAIAVLLAGCPAPDGKPGSKKGLIPGKFQAALMSDTMGGRARAVSLGTYDVANSKSIYFILRNVGDFPITGIELTPGKLLSGGGAFEPITDNAVTASPGAIAVLETSGNTSVETVIEVDINHGNVIGLISQQYVQKADFAGTTLRITGKSVDADGGNVDVSLDLDIETLIKVASFELRYSADGGATYVEAEWGMPPVYVGSYPSYMIPSASKDYVKILNTGNVPLHYKTWKNGTETIMWESDNEWITVNASELSGNLEFGGYGYLFLIDTVGIPFDNGGIENLVFRPGTSIVINYINQRSTINLYFIP